MIDFVIFLLDLLGAGYQRGADRPPPRRPLLGAVVAGAFLAFCFQVLGLAAWMFFVFIGYVSTTAALYVFIGTSLILGVVAGWALLRKVESALARQPPDRYPPAKHPWLIGAVSGSITFLPVLLASYLVVRDAWYAVAIGALCAIVLAVVFARYEYRRASTWPPAAPRAAEEDAFDEGREKNARPPGEVAPPDLRCPQCANTFPSKYWFVDTPSGPLCQNCGRATGS